MRTIKLLIIVLLPLSVLVTSCNTIEDRDALGERISKADLKFTITQNPNYKNQIFLKSETSGIIPYWDYEVGTSHELMDTIILPFDGTYWIKYYAYSSGGPTVDSVEISVPSPDPNYFGDPSWEMLTNNSEGRYWKLFKVTLGPATDFKSVWGEPSWWPADAVNLQDSAYFDLNKGFHYVRYHDGITTPSSFVFNPLEVLTGTVIPNPGQSIAIPSPNQMAVRDGSNEMSESNKSKYRVYKLNNDTLVVGQGSYYTASRNVPTEDWSYYHWYVRIK